ncbi:kielin/chordin-like protein [Coccinella septempunctata]|uniref:kielin/chordin-like protein n=1 Tax=Coccinella septempunctata TaxID=41139 RepID=UPI001D079971|nr:kielin/chordin-like protein [Coccinella septempunctata]
MCELKFSCAFLVTALICLVSVECENPENPLGKYLYEDLKCFANLDASTNQPTYYKCDVSSRENCIFEGKKLSVGEEIKDNGTDYYCRSHCSCNEDGTFDCAEDDCDEVKIDGCRYKDSLTQCCTVLDCEPPKSNCTYNGKTYEEGRTFHPENTCQTCLCQEGFSGKIEQPYCMKRRCLEQIFHMEKLIRKCAAVYFLEDLCCPATWVCDKGQKIEIINATNKTKLSCDFGEKKIALGHGFETTVRPYSKIIKVRCECTLPPFITCLELPGQK